MMLVITGMLKLETHKVLKSAVQTSQQNQALVDIALYEEVHTTLFKTSREPQPEAFYSQKSGMTTLGFDVLMILSLITSETEQRPSDLSTKSKDVLAL